MTFMDLLKKRRSIRKFKSDPVEEDKIKTLKEAILRAPSSRGRNPWRFAFITDKNLIDKLSEAKASGSQLLKGAPLAVVVCGDSNVTDVWVEDCSIASIFLQLAAEDIELASCWVHIRNRKNKHDELSSDYIKRVLDLPENLDVLSVIAIGYPDETKDGHSFDSLEWDKLIES